MALQSNNFMLLDTDGNPRTIDTTNDTLAIAVDLDLGADLSIAGNLSVTGDIISGGTTDVIVTDNFIDLNNGNTVDRSGGLTVNVKAGATQALTAGAGTTFTAQAGGNDAKFVTDGIDYSATSMAVGDIIEISGLVDLSANNGLFVVTSIGNAATGVGISKTNGTRTPFCQTNYEGGVEDAGQVAWDLALSVIAVSDGTLNAAAGTVPKGIFCTAYNVAATKDNLVYESAQAVSMQESYNVGSAITMANPGSGDIVIKTDDAVGTRADFKLQLAAGANYLSTSANGIALGSAGSTGRIAMDGQVSTNIVFDGSAPRTIQQTANNIDLKTVTSGAITVDSAGDLLLESNGTKFDLTGVAVTADCSVDAQFNHASIKTLKVKASNADAGGSGRVEITADGDIDMISDAEMVIEAKNNGANSLVVQSSAGHAMFFGKLGTKVEADTNNLEMKGQVNASLTSTTGNTIIDSTAGLVNSTAATGHRFISTAGGFDVVATAGGFSIDSSAGASNVTATGSALTLSTLTSGNVNLTSAAEIVATAATNATLKSTVGVAKLEAASGAATVLGTGKVTLASSAADLDIDAATTIAMNSVTATAILAGTSLTLETTDGVAKLYAKGAGNNAQVFSDAAGVEVGGATTATVQAQGGQLLINHGHVGSTANFNSASTDATAGLSLNASAGGLSLTGQTQARVASAAGNVVIQSSVEKVLVEAVKSSHFEISGAAAVLSMRSTAADGELELKASAIGMDGFVEYIDAATAKGSGFEYTADGFWCRRWRCVLRNRQLRYHEHEQSDQHERSTVADWNRCHWCGCGCPGRHALRLRCAGIDPTRHR